MTPPPARHSGCAVAGAYAPRCAAPRSARACRSSAPTAGISAQLIDDDRGRTLAAVTWTEPELSDLGRTEQAASAGQLLAQRANEAGVQAVVFDRGGYRYHGRVEALAEGAREGGLAF